MAHCVHTSNYQNELPQCLSCDDVSTISTLSDTIIMVTQQSSTAIAGRAGHYVSQLIVISFFSRLFSAA